MSSSQDTSEQDSSSNPSKEPKPETQIKINVKGLDNTVVQFKIQKHVALGKLMKKYCERKGLAPQNIRFLFDNERVQKESTPLSMGIEDDDTLDIVSTQDGGGQHGAYSLSKRT